MINSKLVSTKTLILCSLLFLYGISELKAEKKVIILKQPEGTPLKILEHKFDVRANGIYHEVKSINTSGRDIDVVQYGFADFDVYKNYVKTNIINAYEVNPRQYTDPVKAGQIQHMEFGFPISDGYEAFGFHGTSFAFVSQVRFADGTVWRNDKKEVNALIKKIPVEGVLTLDDFKEKKSD